MNDIRPKFFLRFDIVMDLHSVTYTSPLLSISSPSHITPDISEIVQFNLYWDKVGKMTERASILSNPEESYYRRNLGRVSHVTAMEPLADGSPVRTMQSFSNILRQRFESSWFKPKSDSP